MSDTDNVQFVGGVAVEQTDGSAIEEGGNENREAAKAAVRKALGGAKKAPKEAPEAKEPSEAKEPQEADKEEEEDKASEDEDEAPKSKAKKKDEDEDLDPDKASLKQVLKHREKIAKAKADQSKAWREEQAQLQAQISQQRQMLQQEQMRVQQEMAKLQKLRSDPAAAVRENGWDPEEFILNLAQSGTPEGKQQAQMRMMQQQLQEQAQWREQMLQAQQRAAEEAQHRQAAEYRTHVERTFLKSALDEKKYPHIAEMYKGREAALVSEGDIIAAQFRHLTGREADFATDIPDYIEEVLAERAKAWYDKFGKSKYGSQQVDESAEEESASEVENRTSGRKPIGKTLNPDSSGERRALSRIDKDLDGDERIELARAEVRKALNRYSKKPKDE